MKAPILVLRLSRRAVAAVMLSGDELTLFDGLHLRSGREAAILGLKRYVQRLIEMIHPKSIVVDAPRMPDGQTEALIKALTEATPNGDLTLIEVASSTILTAFGLPPLRSRSELRAVAEPLFQELATVRTQIRPYILEAAADALIVESAVALGSEPA